jgi:ubiquinone/menaquinone biosynthesis C-methylase UbiE
MTKSLDIGCGARPKNTFNADEVFGIDVREDLAANIYRADLVIDAIPFGDGTFDFVTAHDFLEHVPRVVYVPQRRNAFVEVMNEIWRVLKDGGQLLSFTPAYPNAAAFRDPTHVNIITEETFPLYFDDTRRWATAYGFRGAFKIVGQEWRGEHLLTILQKTMPPAQTDTPVASAAAPSLPMQPHAPAPDAPKSMSMIEVHEKHWNTFMADDRQRALYESWWNADRVNFWRHTQLLAPVFEVLHSAKTCSWLTIGDGAGTDAWMMNQAGYGDVLATDLDDTVLKETHRRGHIKRFQIANAERLDLPDNSVDYILCKEALHHMSRPYAAIYDMLRVARFGVVIIEPQDPWVDWPCLTDVTKPHYEPVGNYVYQFSFREIEKIAYGMNMPGVFLRSLVDVYVDGCEFAYCVDSDPIWIETQQKLAESNKRVAEGAAKPNYVQAVLVKSCSADFDPETTRQRLPGWRFVKTDTNPHL